MSHKNTTVEPKNQNSQDSNTEIRNESSESVSGHFQKEVNMEWQSLKPKYIRLHKALDKLKAQDGDVILFEHLVQALHLPTNLVQNYFETVCFTCIDERAQKNLHNALSIGVPGNFCLEKTNFPKYAKKIVAECIESNITKIKLMPHARCGAAKLAVEAEFSSLGWDTSKITQDLINKKAIQSAEISANIILEIAKKLGHTLDVTVEFIGVHEIEPVTFHNAIGSMINMSGDQSLDLTKLHLDPKLFNKNIDPMFNISGFGDDKSIVDRIKLSIDIAFGGHGLGDNVFSPSNPFLILLICDSKRAVSRAKNNIIKLLKNSNSQKYHSDLIASYIRLKETNGVMNYPLLL